MAILHYKDEPYGASDFNIKEYAIGGKLITASFIIDEMVLEHVPKDEIKRRLANELAQGMIENNLLEFTSMRDPSSHNIRIHVRCYLTPDSQVKIIRELNNARV